VAGGGWRVAGDSNDASVRREQLHYYYLLEQLHYYYLRIEVATVVSKLEELLACQMKAVASR